VLAVIAGERADRIAEHKGYDGRHRHQPDDPKGVELGKDYLKLVAREMPTIPLMSYNVFTSMDTTYWTGYPTISDPYTDPVPNWANSRL
ncbi:hypothetical protein ACC756_37980, partial [Rhizobium ruizarguesonis]